MRAAVMLVCIFLWGTGCSSHTPNPNERMMDKVMGELDRESAK